MLDVCKEVPRGEDIPCFIHGPKDIKRSTVLITKISEGCWLLMGPVKPLMKFRSREEAVTKARSMWKNFYLKTRTNDENKVDDFLEKEKEFTV